jgi:IS4 transposase
MSKHLPANCSKLFLSRLDKFAKKRKFIVRESCKFSAAGYLFALINAIITGQASFNQLAMGLKHSEPHSLTKQAFWKRTNAFAVAFMLDALSLALIEKWREGTCKIPKLQRLFGRVLVQDSSQQKLPKSNHEHFPAHGNGKSVTAGVKVDLAIDLLNGRAIFSQLYSATEQDRDLGKNLVDLVKKRDLILRDRGYFSLMEFAYIEGKSAFWLSRVPSNLIICDEDGGELDEHLRACKGDTLDLMVKLGKCAHKARFVAIRATAAVARKNLQSAKEQALKKGKTLSKSQRLRCQWHLVVTNIPREKMSAQSVSELYRCRWNIEIVFRAWKQSANLDEALNRTSNEDHFQVLMLAAMIYQVLSLSVMTLVKNLSSGTRISLEKLFDDWSGMIIKCRRMEEMWDYHPDIRHLKMDAHQDRQTLEGTWMSLLS